MLLSFPSLLTTHEDPTYKDMQVGVIIDIESRVGKVIYHCITMDTSKFYKANHRHRTRIIFKTRDTKKEPLQVVYAGVASFVIFTHD